MPTPYKRQHYLPVGYLKYFSTDQTYFARDSWIWRSNGEAKSLVRVDSQCSSDYHYSKKDAASAEQTFHKVENRYCGFMEKILFGLSLNEQDYGALLANMFDIYIRNAIHKNNTGGEGIEAYLVRSRIFLGQVLLSRKDGFTAQDVQDHISNYWGVQIIAAPAGRVFITSDNPSVWTSLSDERPGLHLLTLPISPTQVAIAYDNRFVFVVSEQMLEDDYLTLIGAQIHYAVDCVYSSIEPTDNIMGMLKNLFLQKSTPTCQVDATSWQLSLAGLSPEYHFSFIRLSQCK